MTTIARPQTAESSHWYEPKTGKSVYEVPRADGTGMRKTTLADARKLGLVPSVTNILAVLNKPALNSWLQEQVILAVLTTPRLLGEADDAFVQRVLHGEKIQDQESQKAKDRGTEIHAAIEALFQGREISPEIDPWVRPAFNEVSKMGELICTEKVLANSEFGGMIDLVQSFYHRCPPIGSWIITDWKTTKKLPTKGAWPEHVLQCAAYGYLWSEYIKSENWDSLYNRTQNVYISTVDCGKFVVCEHDDWRGTYFEGFAPLVQHWRWSVGL